MNILLIDDHPLITDVYETYLTLLLGNTHKVLKANNCETAFKIINTTYSLGEKFDLVLCDQNLPPFPEENLLNGMHLITLIKKHDQKAKIMMITAHTEVLVLYEIMKKNKLQGFLIKSDVTFEIFKDMITQVIAGRTYYSSGVEKCLEAVWENEIIVDDYNRKILLTLVKGYKVKELENEISLSASAIRKRIGKLKKLFDADDERELIKNAIDKGFM